MLLHNQNSRPGRKPLLDEAKRREICKVLAVGGTRTMAAAYVGCSLDTIARAAKRDRAFAEELRRASVECEIRCLRNLSKAAQEPKNWRAAAWMLERLYPERYARRKHVGLTPQRSPRAEPRHLGIPTTQGGQGRTRRESARPQPPRADGARDGRLDPAALRADRPQPPRAVGAKEEGSRPQLARRLAVPSAQGGRGRTPRDPERHETQNRPRETGKSTDKTQSSASPRPLSRSARRAATPQKFRRENPEITEKNAVFAVPSRAAAALPTNAAPQNHPPVGEKPQKPSNKQLPPLAASASKQKNFVFGATPQNCFRARVPGVECNEPRGFGRRGLTSFDPRHPFRPTRGMCHWQTALDSATPARCHSPRGPPLDPAARQSY